MCPRWILEAVARPADKGSVYNEHCYDDGDIRTAVTMGTCAAILLRGTPLIPNRKHRLLKVRA